MPWPYTVYGSLRSPVESFISFRSQNLQQTIQASRKVSRYDLFAAPCFASLRFKRVWEVQLGWSSSSQWLAPKQKERVYQKNQPKVLSPSFTHQPIPFSRFWCVSHLGYRWSWTHQGRSRATEVLGFLTWKQKTPKKSQQLKRKDTDMTDLKYDVTSITNVPTNVEHNAPSAASYRFCSWCAVANKKFGRTGNDATSCHKLLFFMYIMVKVKKHRAAMVDNGGTKFQQRMAYLWQLVRLGQRNASLEINYEEVQDALTPVGNM